MSKYSRYVRRQSLKRRTECFDIIMNHFYNIWMGKFEISGSAGTEDDLDYRKKHFILDQGWFKGEVSGEWDTSGLIPIFTPFAPSKWDIYNFPTHCHLINLRGVAFISAEEQVIDEQVAICYFLPSREPVRKYVAYWAEKIVDIEMLKDNNIFQQKAPYMIACSPEDKKRLNDLIERIENDEDVIFCDFNDIQAVKTLINNTPYILDKLEDYEKAIEAKILTYLGVNNVNGEKKEHLIVDEVNANNQAIQANEDNLLKPIQEWLERCNNLFEWNLSIELTNNPIEPLQSEFDDNGGNDDGNQN